jgi:Ca2+-binding RTX toxin-like protein
MVTTHWFLFDATQGSSKSSSYSNVSFEGASSGTTATSTNGMNYSETSSQEIYTPGATSSSGTAIATSSPTALTVSTAANTDVAAPSPDRSPDLPLNLFPDRPSPPTSSNNSSIFAIALSPLLTNSSSFSKHFYLNGKRIQGRNINNFLNGGRHNDQLRGGQGDDHLQGKGGNDWLTGGLGDDHLRGGQGDDGLMGGGGDDILVGSVGQDWLTGGKGADRFVLDYGVTTLQLADVITDFNAAQGDKIQVMRGQNSRADALRNIVFQSFDSDGDGSADATLIRSGSSIQAIVLGSVNSSGITLLSYSHLIVVP